MTPALSAKRLPISLRDVMTAEHQTVSNPRSERPSAWRPATPIERFMLLGPLLAIMGVWALALWLAPDPRGYGTHEQMGLLPCMTKQLFGLPCMFCGMTTAVTLVAQGDLADGFQAQPAAALGALFAIPLGAVSAAAAAWGRWPEWLFRSPLNRIIWYIVGVVLGIAWLYKLLT